MQDIRAALSPQRPAAKSLPAPARLAAVPVKPVTSAKQPILPKPQVLGRPSQAKATLEGKQSPDAALQQQQAKPGQIKPSVTRKHSPNVPLPQQQQQYQKPGQIRPSLKRKEPPEGPHQQQQWQQQQQQAKPGQTKPSLKRKESPIAPLQQEQQQHMAKQQKRIYHEFSTQETTTSSDGDAPVIDDAFESCPLQPLVSSAKVTSGFVAAICIGPHMTNLVVLKFTAPIIQLLPDKCKLKLAEST